MHRYLFAAFVCCASATGWSTTQSKLVDGKFVRQATREARVRIRLNMTPYASVVGKDAQGQTKNIVKAERELNHTLRARVGRKNHFYFSDWHIETEPLSFDRHLKKFSVRVTYYRVFGNFQKIEEKVGSSDLSGYLVGGKDNLYNFVTRSSQMYTFKDGSPRLKVLAGFPSPVQPKSVARKTP